MSVSNVSLREGLARGNVSLPAVAVAKATGTFERLLSSFFKRGAATAASQPPAEQVEPPASQPALKQYQAEAPLQPSAEEQYQAETAPPAQPPAEQFQAEAAVSPPPAEQHPVEATELQPPAWQPASAAPFAAGAPLAAEPPAGDDPNRLVEEELQLFFGSRHHAFLPVWRKMTGQGRRLARDWSWSAFLLSGAWLMYRRMYFFGAVAIALPLAAMSLSWWLAGVVLLGVAAASGLLGRSLYVTYAEQKIRALMVQAKTPEEYVAKLQAGGGVSLAGGLAAAAMFAAGAGLMLLRAGAAGLA